MQIFDIAQLAGPEDWSGPTLPPFTRTSPKLRYITTPYRWHANLGNELFAVLDGQVELRLRAGPDAPETRHLLGPGQMMLIEEGEEHVARPIGPARILVLEEDDQDQGDE